MSDSFERLLRTMRRDAAPADACPDAEALAAYLDGGLSRTERDTVERHASQCERCALTMAAVVRLEDAAGTPARTAPLAGHWWRRWRWAVPAATAVVVAAIWTALPRQLYEQDQERTPAVGQAPASPAVPGPGGATEQPAVAPSDRVQDAPPAPPTHANVEQAEPAGARRTAPPATAPSATEAQHGAAVHDDLEERSLAAAPQAVAESAPSKARRTEPPGLTPPAAQKAASDPPPPAPASPAPFAAAAPRAGAEGDAAERVGSVAREATASPHAAGRVPEPVFAAPGGRVVWRVHLGRIERSTDGGGTWATEHAGPIADGTFFGAAVSPDVCWIVGDGGLVLRREATGRWVRASAPTILPLWAVAAQSATAATVTSSDGRQYSTTDGGATWR